MRTPKYRKHSNRDYAFIEWKGERHRLPGKFGSKESRLAYTKFLQDYVYQDKSPTVTSAGHRIWLAELIDQYTDFAKDRYGSEYDVIHASLVHMTDVFPTLAAEEFGPKKLKIYQAHLANHKKKNGEPVTRGYVNAQISRVRRMFRWAVSEELVPASVYESLRTVEPLKFGESPAAESEPRVSVPWEHVEPLLPFLTPTLRAMVLLQWHTGVRSQNITELRPIDVDVTKMPGEWKPPKHKTLYRGKQLLVFLGPKSIKAIAPFLDRDPEAYCFSARESYAWKLEQQAQARKSKRTPGQARKGPGDHVRDFYDSHTYKNAIEFALKQCNKSRAGQKPKLPPIPRWTPHQIRHSKGTYVRAEYDIETAQAVLGHASIDATQIYAQKNLDLARRVALEIG